METNMLQFLEKQLIFFSNILDLLTGVFASIY